MADLEIGANVDLGALKTGMQNASEVSKQAIGGIKTAFDLLGVTINDSVAEWLATLPGLGEAFTRAFPALALAVFGEQIFQVGEKIAKMGGEVRKLNDGMVESANAIYRHAQALELENLKLEDQIQKLQNRPQTNHLKEALIEARQKADDLTDSLVKALSTEDRLLEDQGVGIVKSLFTGQAGTGDIQAEVAPIIHQIEEAYQRLRIAQDTNNAAAEKSAQADLEKFKGILQAKISELQQHEDHLKAIELQSQSRGQMSFLHAQAIIEGVVKPSQQEAEWLDKVNEKFHTQSTVIGALEGILTNYAKTQGEIVKHSKLLVEKGDAELLAESEQLNKERLSQDQEFYRRSQEIIDNFNKEQLAGVDRGVKAMIKAVQDQKELADEQYNGEIEKAKGAEQVKEQLIQQDFLRGKITRQQEIKAIADAKVDELNSEIQFLRAKETLWAGDAKKVQEVENQITKLIQQQNLIRAKAVTDGLTEQQKQWKQVISGMQGAFSSFTQGIISGHQTIAQSWVNLVNDITAKFIEGLERQLFQFLANAAIQETVEAEQSKKSALRNAIDSAGKAYHWAAAWGGPPAGAIAAGLAFAAVESFGSAEGGQWEVPGIQPTILHPQEMVLPAGIASRMRDMVESGGTNGARSALVFAPTIHALDAQGVDRVLTRHQRLFENRVDKVLKKKGFGAK